MSSKGVNNITIDTNTNFVFVENSSFNIPNNFSIIDSEGGFIHKIESNASVYYEMQNYSLPSPEYFTYENSNGDTLNAYFIKPLDFDSTKKYPVLVHTYGGPGYQSLLNNYNAFNYYWHSMLAEKGIITVIVDARGTGGKGTNFKNCTYQQLGKLESDDLNEIGEHIKLMPFVDQHHMAIWGWSYGGFLSTLTAFKSETYDVVISVAPVTNWLYYDAFYTERFMNTPQKNQEGYTATSPLYYVSDFNGKLLLVHGTADDNVHIQNSYALQSALINEN